MKSFLTIIVMSVVSFNSMAIEYSMGVDLHSGVNKFESGFAQEANYFDYGVSSGSNFNLTLGYFMVLLGSDSIYAIEVDGNNVDETLVNLNLSAAMGATYLHGRTLRVSMLYGVDYLISGKASNTCQNCEAVINEVIGGDYLQPIVDLYLWDVTPIFKVGLMASTKWYFNGSLDGEWVLGVSGILKK
ncbi:hypothetical protein [Marinicellulosiphila megalodicopiae]|uniref:hypothetical protein n=1 Tax=Marinicellulosiphila megalodicopiae TaxID=2724896 RepID=UPI003BAF6D8C